MNGYLGEDLLRIAGKMLVVGDTVTVKVDEGQAANPGLRLTYETVFGTKYVLEFQWKWPYCPSGQSKVFLFSHKIPHNRSLQKMFRDISQATMTLQSDSVDKLTTIDKTHN